MQYEYKEVEVRRFKRRNRLNGIESIVSISNRNNFSVEDHLKLMKLNDRDYEYFEVIESEHSAD